MNLRVTHGLVKALIVALALCVTVWAAPLVGVRAAEAVTAAVVVEQWDVDWQTGVVSSEVSLEASGLSPSGPPCAGTWCSWRVEALFADGDVEVVVHTLGSGTVTWASGAAFSRTVQVDETVLREVTHVRGRVWAHGADPDSGAVDVVQVSAPYPPGGVGVDVGSWVVDPDTGQVTYDLTLRWWGAGGYGRPCEGYCSWRLEALYLDGEQESQRYTFASGTQTSYRWAFERGFGGQAVALREITHVRARVWPYMGDPATGWEAVVQVSAPYPPGGVSVDVTGWDTDAATGTTSYDLQLRWWGAGGHGQPCEGFCSWSLQGIERDGGHEWVRHTFGSGTLTSRPWTYERRFTGHDAGLPTITHLRATVWPYGGDISDGYQYEAAVPPYQLAELDAASYQALMAFAPDFDLDIDPATGLLVAVSIGHLARAVCAAAEIEILRGGESQGTQYANSSMTTTQVSLQHLCFALVGLTAATATATVPPTVESFDPADPPLHPGPWPHPRPDTYPDGGGGSGNWPSTAAGGFCDDGETPPEHERTHPLDIDTTDLTPTERQDVITYARLVNSWLTKVGPTTIISPTHTGIRKYAKTAGAAARIMAEDAFDSPFSGDAGHVPDTALSGTPCPPCGWLDMDPAANRRAGQVLRHRVGQVVTHLTVDGMLP